MDALEFAEQLKRVTLERAEEAEQAKRGRAAAWSAFMFPVLAEIAERTGHWWACSKLEPAAGLQLPRRPARRRHLNEAEEEAPRTRCRR